MGRVEREVDFAVWKDVRLRYGAILHGDMDRGLYECCGGFPSGFSGNLNVPYWMDIFVIFELEGERKGGWW